VTKNELLEAGVNLVLNWCLLNQVTPPRLTIYDEGKPTFGTCAYYRNNIIYIWPNSCASVGRAGRQWSYPGYTVDRTPYGVLAHELGHHSDLQHGKKGGTLSHLWLEETKEKPISGYCPNPNEWYAEMFRLFLTNPDLLRILRPKTFERFLSKWPNTVEWRRWEIVLVDSERHLTAVRNKIKVLNKV
jgi:hypothetical protein